MLWRDRISWRWIIRGTCLGLLGICVGLWGLSYFYAIQVRYVGSVYAAALAEMGVLSALRYPSTNAPCGPGWDTPCWRVGGPWLTLALSGFKVFKVGPQPLNWTRLYVVIPFWFPTVLLALVSWIARRKTREPARGFPVEPLASRRENAGEWPVGASR